MCEKKFILYGELERVLNVVEIFPRIKNYIMFIVSDIQIDKCLWEDILILDNNNFDYMVCDNCVFVIFDEENFIITKNKLSSKFNENNCNFICAREWLLDLLKNDKEILHIPRRIRLDVCTSCQLNCVDCYMRKNDYGSVGKGYLSYELYKKFLDENEYIREIEISNSGEVFLNPDLIPILDYTYSKNIDITINNGTNFNFMNEKLAQSLVKNMVREITISIDGASQKIYSMYRKNGNFKKVLDNIKLVNKYKKIYNSEFPKLRWQYILMNHNECDVEKAINLANDLDMEIFFKIDWSGSYVPTDSKKIHELTGFDFVNKCMQSKFNDNICNQMLFSPQINWDGKLLGCCTVFQSDWGKNVFKDGLINSINSVCYRNAIYNLLGGFVDDKSVNPCTECNIYIVNVLQNKYINI